MTANSASIGNVYDIDRNGRIDSVDVVQTRGNRMLTGGLLMFTAPSAPPPATLAIQAPAISSQSSQAAVTLIDEALRDRLLLQQTRDDQLSARLF